MLVPLIPHPPVRIANRPFSTIQTFQRIVEAERESVGRIEDGRAIVLLRIQPRELG